ncbi:hypothetical protein [Zavarzinia compransoris]|uniref:Flagellar protein FlgN n=1 Tax=Zavarzinia compransoris TaxID=1264899 RepID=A0A317DYH0_9PROT|nr:hypothetical protein [Zavarzinia compransoris]PWR19788.1 hypothetical protein DKG75_15110 [Zavarzinia compransoris]TDP45108.1 hypothetical protein DES42_106330 [Zavarzinia compransoris]
MDNSARPLPARDIEAMADLSDRLADAIEAECAVLADRQLTRLQPLIEAKIQVVKAYELHLAQIGGPARVAGDAEARARLKGPTRRLREALALHTVQIAAARTVADRLVRSIADTVAAQARPVIGYGPRAALRTASAAPAAMAIHASI